MNTWFDSFWSLLFPRCCVVCGAPLSKEEECLCIRCNMNLPRTGFHLRRIIRLSVFSGDVFRFLKEPLPFSFIVKVVISDVSCIC